MTMMEWSYLLMGMGVGLALILLLQEYLARRQRKKLQMMIGMMALAPKNKDDRRQKKLMPVIRKNVRTGRRKGLRSRRPARRELEYRF